MQQIGPQKYPFKKQNGTTLNPATEETSTSILGFVSDVYNWFVALFPWDLVSARQTARNITDNQIIPACNNVNSYLPSISSIISSDRGFAMPYFNYVSQGIVGSTVTYTYKSGGAGGSTVATVTVVYTDATLSTIVSVTKT